MGISRVLTCQIEPEYRRLVASPPSAQLCACALDTEATGTNTMLRHVAEVHVYSGRFYR